MKKRFFEVIGISLGIILAAAGCAQNTSDSSKPASGKSAVPSDATALFDASSMTSLPESVQLVQSYNTDCTLTDDSTYGKVLAVSLKSGSTGAGYDRIKFTFSTADMSGKTLYVVMKGKDTVTSTAEGAHNNDIKFICRPDGSTYGSETNTLFPTDDTAFSVYSAAVSDFWSAYDDNTSLTANGDDQWKAITSVTIALQKADYPFSIAAIYYK
jgi:hypothetical protein